MKTASSTAPSPAFRFQLFGILSLADYLHLQSQLDQRKIFLPPSTPWNRLAAMGAFGGPLYPIPLVSLFGIPPDTSLGSTVNELGSPSLRSLFLFPGLRFFRLGFSERRDCGIAAVAISRARARGGVYGSQATINGPGFTVSSNFRAAVSPLISLPAFCRTIPTAGPLAGSLVKKIIIYLQKGPGWAS